MTFEGVQLQGTVKIMEKLNVSDIKFTVFNIIEETNTFLTFKTLLQFT